MGFTFKVTESKFTPLPEKAWYPARLLYVAEEVMTFNNAPQAKFKFYFAILHPEDYEGREVHGMVNQPTNRDLNERHFLYQWITTLMDGRAPSVGDDVNFPDQFFGKIVMVKLKTTTKDYGKGPMTFQNVDKISICPPAEVPLYKDRAPDFTPGIHNVKAKKTDQAGQPKSPDPEPPKEQPEVPAHNQPQASATQPEPQPEPETPALRTDDGGPAPWGDPKKTQEPVAGSDKVIVDGQEEEIPF